jgi:hypothetical protein
MHFHPQIPNLRLRLLAVALLSWGLHASGVFDKAATHLDGALNLYWVLGLF